MSATSSASASLAITDLDSQSRLDERLAVARVLAGLRLALLAIVFAGDKVLPHLPALAAQFDATIALAAVYSVLMLYRSFRGHRRPVRPGLLMASDLIFLAGLAFASGSAFLEVRAAFLVLPLGGAFLLSPRRIALLSMASCGTYIAVALLHPARVHLPPMLSVLQGSYILWMGIAAMVLGQLLARRRHAIVELAAARGRLVAQAVGAEERARRRLSESLHDHAIQNLLVARQDLAEVRAGDPDALDRAERALRLTVEQLRGTIRELHPYMLEHLGLATALEAIGEEQAGRGGFAFEIDVEAGAEAADEQLIAAVARELLGNIARHARAGLARLSLACAGDHLELVVEDDGCGFREERRHEAIAEGHIGLATAVERVVASGGGVEISSAPGQGTRIRCRLPALRSSHGRRSPAGRFQSRHTGLVPARVR